MSDPATPVFSVVAEGKTDFIVIKAALGSMCQYDAVVMMIQPEYSASFDKSLGEGWTGVRNWCEQCRDDYGGLGERLAQAPLVNTTALVIHVDADIAGHEKIACERPCPPASDTVDALRETVLGWGGEQEVPPAAVLCIPSKSTEAWVLAALYPDDKLVGPDLECRRDPAASLKQRPEKLVRGEHKMLDAYRDVAERMTEGWRHVRKVCTQAARFASDFADAVSAKATGGSSDAP